MKNLEKLKELAASLPKPYTVNASALVERMGEVIEGLSDKPMEYRPPTLKLVQATSDRSKLPKGASIGSLVLGESVLSTPVKTIPVRVYSIRQMWDADPEKASVICSSPDGITGFKYGDCKVCPHQKFDEVERKSACNKGLTVLAITEDLSQLFFINFAKTNYSSGTDWQSLMRKASTSPYKRIYDMSTGTSPKAKNVEIIKVEPAAVNVVDAKIIPFLDELFRITDADRKESLDSFYTYLKTKQANSPLAITEVSASEADGSVTLITAVSSNEGADAKVVTGYAL